MQTLPVRYGASYASATLLAAGGVINIITPGTNLRGIIIHAATLASYCPAFGSSSLLGKASPPVNVADGVPVLTPDYFSWNGANGLCGGRREQELFLPAGLGLYRFSVSAESVALVSVLYTVLP